MSFKTLKKDDLKIIAEELGLEIPNGAKIVYLKELIENSEIYKNDIEFVQGVIDNIIEERKCTQEKIQREQSESEKKIELEKIKLAQLQAELALAETRRDLPQSQNNASESSNLNIENLIKSVKTLTISVPTKAESFNLFFQSIEKAFRTKKVPDDLKAEILLNILGEKVTNLMVYVKEEDINDYGKLKSMILKEFQPTPQECLNYFRSAQKLPSENFVQFASRLGANFEYYCQLRNVHDFKSLCELMVSDKIFGELDRELKSHIAVKQGETWFEPQNLGRECDIYLSSKGKQKQESFFAKSFSGSDNKRGEGNYANKYRNYKNVSNVYVSGVKNHMCILCKTNQNHALQYCPNFKVLSVYERVEIIKQNNLCYKCFSSECNARKCKAKNCFFCNKLHHQMIHFHKEKKNSSEKRNDVSNETQCNSSVSMSSSNLKPAVLLLTCTAYASDNHKAQFNKLTRILCDNGSERSWCNKSLAKCLKLKPIREERLSVFSFGSTNPIEKLYEVVELKLSSIYNPNKFIQFEVLVADTITAAPISLPNVEVRNIMHSRGLNLADCCESEINIEILIGADVFWQIIEASSFERIDQTITCVPTIFGFALQGSQESYKPNISSVVSTNFCVATSDVQMLWELEALGIKEKEELNLSDKVLIEQFENNLKFVNGRYETDLLWKFSCDELGNNYNLAKRRFNELGKDFSKNSWIANEYREIINEQKENGVIEECKRDEHEYFMPHRAVVRENKETTRVRIVFNCSSKSKGNLSLNDCLETGPSLNPNILDVILNFRNYKIAINGDIEKAFLMIRISEGDRKFLKFLWYSDNPSEECKFMRMKRLPFGCKTSPFILSATIKYHIKNFEKSKPKSFEMLNSALYVDDLYYGGNSVSESFELSSDAVAILKSGGFNLRKLRSNSKELEKLWKEKGLSDNELVGVQQLKVLGLNWCPDKDELSLEVKGLIDSWKVLRNSKRCVLQTAARIFDPVGLISPFVVRVKLLLQEIWERACDWDEELPEDLRQRWSKWCGEIRELVDVAIPRYCFLNCENEEAEVHIFCDASLSAYGAVGYFRYCENSGNYRVSFIMSKSRVAPLKKLTLPRLELMALVIGSRVGTYLKSVFKDKIGRIVFWSDSCIALYWVKGSAKRWKQFVANRVVEIQDKSSPSEWCYCPSEDNPADLLTRGISAENLVLNEKWWSGPIWLQKDRESWPKQLVKGSPGENSVEILREQRKDTVKSFVVQLELVEQLWSKFSVWSKLLRVVTWCLRFIRNARGDRILTDFLDTKELKDAHDIIIKLVQRTEYDQEISALVKKTVLKKSPLISLNPFLDNCGLLRVGGRLRNANLPETTKHPLILPKNHSVTKLLVKFYHLTYMHGGVQLVNSAMKQNYWIIGAKTVIRRELKNCVICARFRSEFSKQIMADLPSARVHPGRAFNKCGTDFAGPFLISPRRGRGVKPLKMYVCVIVCFTTKAVHLELVTDLSAQSCVAALKRFIARRGKPVEIFSDCGTNFIGAKNYLKACTLKTFGSYLTNEGVKWTMNVPSAPHFGGLWEAAVKSMKFHMKRVIGSQILSQEEFSTCLAEIEAVLNSRPLVPASEDPNDFSVITPGHFLIGFELKRVPEPDLTSERIPIRERYKLITQISQSFWKSWSKDYLTQLQVRNKWKVPSTDLRVNDLVLIKDDNSPPLKWKMARVIKTFTGTDDRVRSVNLKTVSGELKRPIHKLVRLPVDA